jgi:hypothetical protein
LSHSTPPCSSHHPYLYPLWGRTTKKQLGVVRTEQGKWVLPNGREIIWKPLMRGLLTYLHQGSHLGLQAMCNAVLWAYGCIGIYTLAKQVSEGYLRLLLENIILRFGVIENTDSDNGSHFTANVLKGLMKAL